MEAFIKGLENNLVFCRNAMMKAHYQHREGLDVILSAAKDLCAGPNRLPAPGDPSLRSG